jgi:hypothetical protein
LDYSKFADNCPFIDGGGCTVFADRPGTCRLHPLGVSCTLQDGEVVAEVFLAPEAITPGAGDSWTVASWLGAQEFNSLEADLNRQWLHLLLFKCEPDAIPPDGRTQGLFAMVAYDLDKFRRFIFETPFLEIFEISLREAEPLKNDDLELLKFGFRYLRMILGIECSLSINEEVRRNAFPSDPSIANLYTSF